MSDSEPEDSEAPTGQRPADNNSSEEDESDVKDLDEREVKLAQMRRSAQIRSKATRAVGRLRGLQTFEEQMRMEGLRRMEDGLKKILCLHTPYELSSICGQLNLKVQQKGSTSIELITGYVFAKKKEAEVRMKEALNCMWEGVFYEYLRSIGHPQHSMLLDPKIAVMKLWYQGGMLSGTSTFIPHFIAREVKRRAHEETAEDIRVHMDKIRLAQDRAKAAERRVVSDHDYTNILEYFRCVGDLRTLENTAREYFVGELEVTRSRIDSEAQISKMNREHQAELELLYASAVDNVNEALGRAETQHEAAVLDKVEVDQQLNRLYEILQSYHQELEERQKVGSNSVNANAATCVVLTLRNPEHCSASVRRVHEAIATLRTATLDADDALRDRCRKQDAEIARLETYIRDSQERLEGALSRTNALEARLKSAERDIRYAAKKMMRMKLQAQYAAQESWDYGLRLAEFRANEELRRRRVQPALLAALKHSNPLVVKLAGALDSELSVLPKHLRTEAEETAQMMKQDALGGRLRVWEYQQELKAQAAKRAVMTPPPSSADGKKKGGGAKKGGGSKDKETGKDKKATSGADDSSVGSNGTAKKKKKGEKPAKIGEGSVDKPAKKGGASAKKGKK